MPLVKFASKKALIADISLLGTATIWGVTFLMVQDVTKEIPVFAFLFWRFLFSAFLLFTLAFALKQLHFDFTSLKAGVFLGVLLALGYAFQTFSLQYSLSSVVGFITGLNVVFVPIFMWILFFQRQSLFTILGIMLSILGLWLISTNGGKIDFRSGELLALGGALFFALHIIYTSILSKKHALFPLILAQFFTVSTIYGLLSLIFDPFLVPQILSFTFIKTLLITVIFATVLAFLVQTYMQRFTSPAKVAVIFTAEPLAAGIFGYFYAGELLDSLQILGGFLIILSMLCIELLPLVFTPRSSKT